MDNKLQVSFYKNHSDNKGALILLQEALDLIAHPTQPVKNVIQKLRTTQDETLKSKLPGVTFSGTFLKRDKKNLLDHSGFLILDFDDFETEVILEQERNKLQKNDFIYCVFLSPSGTGLKALIKIPPSTADEHTQRYNSIYKYFNTKYLDKSGKDVVRLCYLSFDEKIYINEKSLLYEGIEIPAAVTPKKTNTTPIYNSNSFVIDNAVKMVNDAVDGEKHHQLLKAAFLIGGAAAIGEIDEIDGYNSLMNAIQNKNPSSLKDAETTIKKGIAAGREKPLAPAELKQPKTKTKTKYNEISAANVIEPKNNLFYLVGDENIVKTSSVTYADFFISKNFQRISTGEDKVQLLINDNNVIDWFNHKTDTVAYLEKHIEKHPVKITQAIRERIMKDNLNIIQQSFLSIHPTPLVYYSDNKNTFGLPFKNGFYSYENNDIIKKEYSEVNGFFAPHNVQKRDFAYTDDKGIFETFLERAATGEKNSNNIDIANEFKAMFGYLCHTYKSQTLSPSIILTDAEANDENRNGRRGKTLITQALQQVQSTMQKGGLEFDASYTHVFADLERKHRIYIIDDVPASFKYDDLYTNILGGINCQRKGSKAELIEFKDSPKFIITTNWVVRYDSKNASTNARFLEYKFSNYYNQYHTPKDDFNCTFFEDWDSLEWNRFYSFVFRSVKLFLSQGIKQIPYDKEKDNYIAAFGNDAKIDEMDRIMMLLINKKESFNVSSFLWLYSHSPMKGSQFFNHNNAKKLIELWMENRKRNDWFYHKRLRSWEYSIINV
jgi:hypothetical protein